MSSSNIDALPYYDKQVDDPATRAAAQSLIDAELRQNPQLGDDDSRLPPEIQIFSKSESLAELLAKYPDERIRGIDATKYEVPTVGEESSLEVLKEAEKRGRIGEGHMALRQENVSLLASYGPNAWLVRNYQLNAELTELQSALTAMKERVTEVNRSRRVFQEDAGQHLSRLEGRWQDLIGGTVQLEMACMAMEGEVRGLRRKEEELRKEVEELEAQ